MEKKSTMADAIELGNRINKNPSFSEELETDDQKISRIACQIVAWCVALEGCSIGEIMKINDEVLARAKEIPLEFQWNDCES